eukprot:1653179-Amphidinium_carterae.1
MKNVLHLYWLLSAKLRLKVFNYSSVRSEFKRFLRNREGKKSETEKLCSVVAVVVVAAAATCLATYSVQLAPWQAKVVQMGASQEALRARAV